MPVHAGAVGEHAFLGKRSNLPRQFLRYLACLAAGHHAGGQADGQRLVGLDRTAGEDQVEGATLTDDARQTHGAAVDQRHAEAPAEHAAHGVLGHHPQVGEQRQLQPAGHGMAFDGGDQRLGQLHAARPHRPVAFHLQAIAPLATLGDGCQVGTGAEGPAATGEHRHPRLLVHLEGTQGIGQRLSGGSVDRVAHGGAIDDQGGDRTVLLDNHVHGGAPEVGWC
ncbi:hypothetical protein D9M71_447630 [compost metagenome]